MGDLASRPPQGQDEEEAAAAPSPARHRGRRRAAAATGSVLVIGAAALGVLRSPVFGADRLIVEGEGRLGEARVLRTAGIELGDNVVWFDADEARRRLEADPWIASASIWTDLPHTIGVRITERTPVGAIETHDGWEVVASDGVILARPADPPRLTTITALVPGDDIASLGAELLGAMTSDLRSQVDSLTVGVDGAVRLVLRGGISVTYGGTGEATEKAQALEAVLTWAEDERAHVQEIDVSVPGAPTARLAGGAVASP
jgi:cell division protein FtsQ